MEVDRNDAHGGQVIPQEKEEVIMSDKGRIQCVSKMLKHTHTTTKGKKWKEIHRKINNDHF